MTRYFFDTVVGSFGLVTVAPLTALTSGFLLTRKRRKQTEALVQETEHAETAHGGQESSGTAAQAINEKAK